MTAFWAQKIGDKIIPLDPESWAEFARVPFSKPVHVEIKQRRNGAHHRLFFVLVHRVANGLGVNPEALRDHLAVRTGHVQIVKTRHGVKEYPASISFASMDQTDFARFFNACIVVICEDLGMRRPDILDSVADIIDGSMPEMRGAA